ncbi:DUF2946 family protein [Caenispirillum bisanense]|uniref:DUF2946 family protein n=1 Tax=Caenispirillum bisanense TaxID=414052 RepID=UPI0031DE0A10
MSTVLAVPALPTVGTRRRLMGWLGLSVLLVGLLAAALTSSRLTEQPHPGAELPLGQILICTGAGLAVIALDGSLTTLPPPAHPADDLCLLCLPLAPAAVALAAVVLLILPPPRPMRQAAPVAAQAWPVRRLRCFGTTRTTRGPPTA